MVSKEIKVINAEGLHMRPASALAAAMGKYGCNVSIEHNQTSVNAKSVLHLMAACIKCGAEIRIVCDGPDEEEALKAAVSMFEAGFGEK